MPTIRGVVFDMDGTLADTIGFCIEAMRRAAEPWAGRLEDADITATWGPSEEGSVRVLAPGHEEECLAAFFRHYEELHAALDEPFPGIRRLLARMRDRGIRRAVATGKGPVSCAISLRLLGLEGDFDQVEAGCADRPCKPEAIGRILERWNLSPEEAAYVGDSPSDVLSARKAGVAAWGAAWTPQADADAIRANRPDALFLTVPELEAWLFSEG